MALFALSTVISYWLHSDTTTIKYYHFAHDVVTHSYITSHSIVSQTNNNTLLLWYFTTMNNHNLFMTWLKTVCLRIKKIKDIIKDIHVQLYQLSQSETLHGCLWSYMHQGLEKVPSGQVIFYFHLLLIVRYFSFILKSVRTKAKAS